MTISAYSNYAAVRAITSATAGDVVNAGGHTSANDGGAGFFYYDATDTTTADDDGTVLVGTSSNFRWKRQFSGPVSVGWFGAAGRGADYTSAFQNWLAFLKNNLGRNFKSVGAGYVPPGVYSVSQSLNCTGTSLTITGDDAGNTVIYGDLTDGPYPILDCTDCDGLTINNLQIVSKGSATNQATCCILLAQDRAFNGHTYNNSLNNLVLYIDASSPAPNTIAALVIQNNDLLKMYNVNAIGSSGLGVSMGWRLPIARLNVAGGIVSGVPLNQIQLDSGASATTGTYVGLSIRLVSGTGASAAPIINPVIGKITAYNGATQIATIDTNFAAAPDTSTVFEIYAIQSKFNLVPQCHVDATHYTMSGNCEFTGTKGIQITGVAGLINLGDSYANSSPNLDSDACAIYIANTARADLLLGEMSIMGRGLGVENQTSQHPFYALKSAYGAYNPTGVVTTGSNISLSLDAVLNGPQSDGAVIYDASGLGFYDLELNGICVSGGNLLNVTAPIQTLRGSFRTATPAPSTITPGMIASVDFDWQDRSKDNVWVPFFQNYSSSIARTGAGLIGPNMAPAASPPAGTLYKFALPANILASFNGINKSARFHLGFTAAATGTVSFNLRQGSATVALGSLSVVSGNKITLDYILEFVYGTGFLSTGFVLNGSTAVQLEYGTSTYSSLNYTSEIDLDIDASSSIVTLTAYRTDLF